MRPDDDEECRLWHAASLLLSAPELQAVVDELNDPPLPSDMAHSALFFPLEQLPPALLQLLQPYVLPRERPTSWAWDDVGPGIFLPEALSERLHQRLAVALLQQLKPFLLPVPPDLPAQLRDLVGDIEIDLDQPLPEEAQADRERRLYELALSAWGPEGLDDWLRAQFAQHVSKLGVFQGDFWLQFYAGPLLPRLIGLGLLPNLVGQQGSIPTGEDMTVFDALMHWLSSELLRALPVDALSADLRERRLQIDLGV